MIFLPCRRLWFFAYGVGLSLHSYRSISFAPVRGGTYFLCRGGKESKQRKRAATADMTPGVNRDRFFSFSNLYLPEFPEGDVAVHLDGGSRFYERDFVKIAFAGIFIPCLRRSLRLKSPLRS